jgi:hypothetical protein
MHFDIHRSKKLFSGTVSLVLMLVMLLPAGGPSWGAAAGAEKERALQSSRTGSGKGKIPFPMPESHRSNWLEYHGASADVDVNGAGQRGEACLTCHERNDCIDCHNTRPPRDHTNTWRTLSHGFMAAGNRERCLACHRQDYCVRCHNETAPRSHVRNWIANHCTWCHFESYPVPADGCGVCHRRAPHASGPIP